MARFDDGMDYVNTYLGAKAVWLNGSVKPKWFASGAKTMTELLTKFAVAEEDAEAYKTYGDIKDPKKTVAFDKERKHRLRLLFLAAATMAVRKQFLAGKDNVRRTSRDAFRYEICNSRSVRGQLNKFKRMTDNMDAAAIPAPGISGGAH